MKLRQKFQTFESPSFDEKEMFVFGMIFVFGRYIFIYGMILKDKTAVLL